MKLAEPPIVAELMASGRMPSPTGVALTILDLTRDPNTSTDDMAMVLQADPALTGQILKYANSATGATRGEIMSINDALVRLGMSMIRQLCLGFSVLSNARSGPCEKFDYQQYWTRSLAMSVSCQALTKHIKSVSSDEGFTCGLLCNIGSLALASVHPQTYARVLADWEDGQAERLQDLEHDVLNITQHQVSAALFEDWGLPEYYRKGVIGFGDLYPGQLPKQAVEQEKSQRLTRLLSVASLVAEICLDQGSDRHAMVLQFMEIGESLGYSEEQWFALYDDILADWARMGRMLNILTQNAPSLETLVQRARQAQGQGTEDAKQTRGSASVSPQEILPTTIGTHNTPQTVKPGLEILVAANQATDMQVIETQLVEKGHQLTHARTGRQALEAALQTNPQLILADWDLSDMNGLELCRTLRQSNQGSQTHMIIMTDETDTEKLVEVLNAGADDYLTKPLNPRFLAARLGAAERLIKLQEQAEYDREEVRRTVAELSILNRQLKTLALEDQLTRLPNRRAGLHHLDQEWARAARTGDSLLCMLLDIDHFKTINDTFGHDVGDEVLKETATVLKSALRDSDIVCRFGGEEFLAICPDADLKAAKILGDRIRLAVQNNQITTANYQGQITVSVGIAIRTKIHVGPSDLIKEADEALYAAKEAGRNLVCIADPEA